MSNQLQKFTELKKRVQAPAKSILSEPAKRAVVKTSAPKLYTQEEILKHYGVKI